MAPQTPAQRAANQKFAKREEYRMGKRVAPTYKKADKRKSSSISTGWAVFFAFLIGGGLLLQLLLYLF